MAKNVYANASEVYAIEEIQRGRVLVQVDTGYSTDYFFLTPDNEPTKSLLSADRAGIDMLLDTGVLTIDVQNPLSYQPDYGAAGRVVIQRQHVADLICKYHRMRDAKGRLIDEMLADGIRILVKPREGDKYFSGVELRTNAGHIIPIYLTRINVTVPTLVTHGMLALSDEYVGDGFRRVIRGPKWGD